MNSYFCPRVINQIKHFVFLFSRPAGRLHPLRKDRNFPFKSILFNYSERNQMTSTKTGTKNEPDIVGIIQLSFGRKRKYQEIEPFHQYLDRNFNLDSELIGLDSSKSHNRKRFSREIFLFSINN